MGFCRPFCIQQNTLTISLEAHKSGNSSGLPLFYALIFQDKVNSGYEENRAGNAWKIHMVHSKALKTEMIDRHYSYHLPGDHKAHHIGRANITDDKNDGNDVKRSEHTAHKARPGNLLQVSY